MGEYNRLRGFTGQSMAGRMPTRLGVIATYDSSQAMQPGAPGSFSYTAPVSGWALVWAWGGAGGGRGNSANSGAGGAGGGGAFKRIYILAGQVISGTVGAGGLGALNAAAPSGGTTTVNLPDGSQIGGTGGTGGNTGAAPPGVGFGGEANSTGGAGGAQGLAGGTGGDGGSAGGDNDGGNWSGGGGTPGFSSIAGAKVALPPGGSTGFGANEAQYLNFAYGGRGNGAATSGLPGGHGRVLIHILGPV